MHICIMHLCVWIIRIIMYYLPAIFTKWSKTQHGLEAREELYFLNLPIRTSVTSPLWQLCSMVPCIYHICAHIHLWLCYSEHKKEDTNIFWIKNSIIEFIVCMSKGVYHAYLPLGGRARPPQWDRNFCNCCM